MAVDRLAMRLDLAAKGGAGLAVNSAERDVAEAAREFTLGYGIDTAFVAFGGDATEAMQEIAKTMKTAPDGHRMGVIVIVGGARFESSWPVPFGNVDVRASSRPGPGYHDEEWEHGRDYPPVFVEWTTRRNLEEVLRAASEGTLAFAPLITHRAPLREAPAMCEELIEHPDRALGVILNP
jgi:threonine dehydrogenase-like Zn-dependent dehydrogenase